MDRRTALTGIGATASLLLVGGVTSATALESPNNQRYMSEDEQLDYIIKKLESLPRYLKVANPSTYPNYQVEIEKYLKGVTVVVPQENGIGTGANPNFNFWACAGSLAGFVASTGIPVLKIIGWIQKARRIWGGVRGILTAIRCGVAAVEIGGEAATVLLQILGAEGIVKNCFN